MKKLIESLRQYRVVAVVGPNRSGTRITAKILAHELGWEYRDEQAVGMSEVRGLLENKQQVYHATAGTHAAHEWPKDVGVVFVMRPPEEIRASQKRVNWTAEQAVLCFYETTFGETSLPTEEMQQRVWREKQAPEMTNAYTLEYHALEGHSLWRDSRENYKWNQTS